MSNPVTTKDRPNLVILTKLEEDILKLICEEHISKEIGAMLELSTRSIEAHKANMKKKIGVKNRKSVAGLVLYAINSGIVKVEYFNKQMSISQKTMG